MGKRSRRPHLTRSDPEPFALRAVVLHSEITHVMDLKTMTTLCGFGATPDAWVPEELDELCKDCQGVLDRLDVDISDIEVDETCETVTRRIPAGWEDLQCAPED